MNTTLSVDPQHFSSRAKHTNYDRKSSRSRKRAKGSQGGERVQAAGTHKSPGSGSLCNGWDIYKKVETPQ